MDLDREKLRGAGWLAAAVVAALLVVKLLGGCGGGGPGETVTVDPAGPRPAAPGASSQPPPAEALVHVAGEVRSPGVYRLPRNARIHDAIRLAGGMTRRAEQTGVNLVARVSDGQQVIVPRRGGAPGPSGAAAGPSGSAPGPSGVAPGPSGVAPGTPGATKVSLASATLEQLDAVDGIGPTLAQRILEYRDKHGGFRSVDELRQVDGIGAKRFESLREAVTP